MMTLHTSYLFFLSIFIVQVISESLTPLLNESSPRLGAISRTGNMTGTALNRALSTALPFISLSCDGCEYIEAIDSAPWPSPTTTVLVLIDNSTNITSTSTIQDQVSTFETDVSIASKQLYTGTIQLEEKVHLTYPTLYDIYHGFIRYTKFSEYTTILNGTSASSSPLCRFTEITYTNVFAVPLVDGLQAKGSALANYESFYRKVISGCRPRFGNMFYPIIKVPASVLTITSFGSLATSATANPSPSPSPSATAQNPVVLATTPVHSQNGFETPHSDNASPKRIPSRVSQSASDSPPLITSIPTTISKPQSAGLKQPSIHFNANTQGNPESDSPIPTQVLPVQREPNGPNSADLDSLSNSVLTNWSPLTLNDLSQSVPTLHGQPESILPSKAQPNPELPVQQPATRLVITVGSKPVTANPSLQFAIDGKTLSPGGSAITVDGTPISLAPFASHVVISDSTVLLASPQPSSLPRLTLGGGIITANSLSQFVIDRQTLWPGGPEITVFGTPIRLAASATHVVIAGNTVNLANSPSPLFTFPGRIITPDSKSNYVIGGQTLIPGSGIFISGTLVSLAPSASEVIIGSSTIQLLASSSLYLPFLIIGEQTIAANSASQYIIGGQTLAAGSPAITVSGTPISLSPFTSNVVVGGSTIPLATASNTPHALTFRGSLIFPNSASEYVIGSQTITPGAPAVTISGTPISLAPSASNIIIRSITSALIGSATPLPPLTIDGSTILPNSASEYLIGRQTLMPGASAITIFGTRISLAPSASALVIGSNTIPLTSGPALTTAPPLITIGNSDITPNAASQYIIAGQTLIPGGPAITVSGTRISLAPQASDVVVGTSTEELGRLILAGIGATPASVNGSAGATGPMAFQGAATRVYGQRWILAIFIFGWGLWGCL